MTGPRQDNYHQVKENLEQALEEYRDALPAGQADAAENLYAAARALSDSLNLFTDTAGPFRAPG